MDFAAFSEDHFCGTSVNSCVYKEFNDHKKGRQSFWQRALTNKTAPLSKFIHSSLYEVTNLGDLLYGSV